VLAQLVGDLAGGRLRIVDLTQLLGPETPVIGLPAIFGASPGVTLDTISRFDEQGPAWYWNTIRMGEHTGTHFDAPVHWITGKDLPQSACDTIPVDRFVGPACVIDVTADVAKDEDFLLTPERIHAWEAEHGRVPARSSVLLRTGWSRRADAALGDQERVGRAQRRQALGQALPLTERKRLRPPLGVDRACGEGQRRASHRVRLVPREVA